MKNYFFKPELENLSQGARLKFVRKLRYMKKEDVAEFLKLGGKNPTDTVSKYERNEREAELKRFKKLSELFNVSVYAIQRYNFTDSNEVVHYHMWEEELCPYSEFILNIDAMKNTYYNKDIIRGLEEWEKMRIKREKREISDSDYIEWKLNFKLEKEIQ